jgi:hypothetical protein
MKLLLTSTSTNPEYDCGCGCAVLELTPDLLAEVEAHVALAERAAEACEELWELYFWGGGPTYHDSKLVDACDEVAVGEDISPGDWQRRFEEQGFLPLPEGLNLDRFEARSTECDQQIIRCRRAGEELTFEVAWTVSPKHTDLYITTQAIPLKELRALAGQRVETAQAQP